MKLRRPFTIAAIATTLCLTGCTLPSSGKNLPAAQVGQMQKLSIATIIKIRDVVIDGTRTNLGQYSGAVLGGAVALPSGGMVGRGDAVVMAGASIIGAIAGNAIEEYATRKKAQEITIQMPNGDVFVIVQPSPPIMQVGDKVNVIHGPNGARLELALDY